MSFRNALLATTILVFPVAVEAQTSPEPVTGIYLGAAGGFNIKTNPNINGIETNIPGAAGRATPNANLSTGIGGAAVGTIGYGLGNGLRVEGTREVEEVAIDLGHQRGVSQTRADFLRDVNGFDACRKRLDAAVRQSYVDITHGNFRLTLWLYWC